MTSAVDLALRSNPRVQSAQAEVARARAQLSEMHDVYIPAVSAGAGIGQAYGYLPNPPTLFTINAGSLVFGASQMFYTRSARAGLKAAQLSLQDVREAVAQDTALAFITLDHDQQRAQAIQQQADSANRLVQIVQQRLDAGQDTQLDLTQARLTAAQLHLALMRGQDEVEYDREHLARMIGVPPASLRTDGRFPSASLPAERPTQTASPGYANAGIAAAFSNAEAKQQQARGDARYRFWPQLNLVVSYNRYATFTNSFGTLESFSGNHPIGANEAAFGVQINMPFLDRVHDARARQTAAEATKALRDAQNAQNEALDGEAKARHSIDELHAQADVASLQQQLAQQQLEILNVQLQSGTGSTTGQQMTPKDEEKARIDERDKYLNVIDATFQLRQAEIQLLRQQGQLENWLRSSISAPAGSTIQNTLPPTPGAQR